MLYVDMVNVILSRRDAYLNHLCFGVKPNMAASFCLAALYLQTLFSEDFVQKAWKEVSGYDRA